MKTIRNRMIGALCFAIVAFPTAASAELQPTPEQRAACMGDAVKLCSSVLFSVERVRSCLLSKKSAVSPRCQAVLS